VTNVLPTMPRSNTVVFRSFLKGITGKIHSVLVAIQKYLTWLLGFQCCTELVEANWNEGWWGRLWWGQKQLQGEVVTLNLLAIVCKLVSIKQLDLMNKLSDHELTLNIASPESLHNCIMHLSGGRFCSGRIIVDNCHDWAVNLLEFRCWWYSNLRVAMDGSHLALVVFNVPNE
jgi:hypothetical protein